MTFIRQRGFEPWFAYGCFVLGQLIVSLQKYISRLVGLVAKAINFKLKKRERVCVS